MAPRLGRQPLFIQKRPHGFPGFTDGPAQIRLRVLLVGLGAISQNLPFRAFVYFWGLWVFMCVCVFVCVCVGLSRKGNETS